MKYLIIDFFCEKPESNIDCPWLGNSVTLEVTIKGIKGNFTNIKICKKKLEEGECPYRLKKLEMMNIQKNNTD